KTYPESLDRLKNQGIALRLLDAKTMMGGVQHAKYLVVDDDELYIGSANFDWRSLDHVHELGLHVRSIRQARILLAIFDGDWEAADGRPPKWFSAKPFASVPDNVGAPVICAITPAACGPRETIGSQRIDDLVASPLGFIPGNEM